VLAARFDTTPLVPELRRLAASVEGPRGKSLQRQLRAGSGAEKGRTAAAAAAAEALELLASSLEPATITRLADFAGLPRGDDEEALAVDARAAAARAMGELFFEDIGATDTGLTPKKSRSSKKLKQLGGASDAAVADAAAAATERAFAPIEGIEALRPVAKAEAKDKDAEVELPQQSPLKRPAPGTLEALDMDDAGDDAGASDLAKLLLDDDAAAKAAAALAQPPSRATTSPKTVLKASPVASPKASPKVEPKAAISPGVSAVADSPTLSAASESSAQATPRLRRRRKSAPGAPA